MTTTPAQSPCSVHANVLIYLACVLLPLGAGCGNSAVRSAAAAVSATTRQVESDNLQPIELARRFWIAFIEQDIAALQRYCMPNPDLQMLWLHSDGPLPSAVGAHFKEIVQSCPARVLKSGDRFVASGELREMLAYDAAAYCPVYLDWPVDPLVECRKDEADRWRVDAGGWIAARKAAARVRAEQSATTNRAGSF
jgi:hypothetical protein